MFCAAHENAYKVQQVHKKALSCNNPKNINNAIVI